MMKRNSSLSRATGGDGKRYYRGGRSKGWAQGDAGYSLLPEAEGPGDGYCMPLRSFKDELCLEKQLQPGDTLQSLALEFNCSTAELRRVNRILKDNEIFALRVVKIPARCYSLLTEHLPSVHTTACSSEGSREDSQDTPVDLHAPVVPPRDLQGAGDAGSVMGLLDGDPEDGALPPLETDAVDHPASHRGLSWLVLLLCILMLGIVGFLLYLRQTTLRAYNKT